MRSSSSQPVSQNRRSWRYRPELIALEARLVPGENLLSAALTAAWLTAATPAAAVRSAERSADAGSLALLDDAPAAALPRISAAVTGLAEETIPQPVSAGMVSHDGLELPDMTSALQHAALGAGSSFASQGALPLTGGSLQTAPDIGSFAVRGSLFAGHADAESHLELLAAGLRGTATTSVASVPKTAVTPQHAAAVRQQLAQLPLSFEANQGQADPSVRFLSHGQGYSLYLTATEAVVVLSQPATAAAPAPADALSPERLAAPVPAAPAESRVVRFGLEGGNPNAEVRGVDPLPGKVNYFLGNDHAKWTTNIATYGKVAYAGVYPGVDLVYYGSGGQLEYDFVVAPGADPSQVRLHVQGADRLEVDGDGALVVHAGGLELRQHRPVVYQEVGGVRQEIAAAFVIRGQDVSFALGGYEAGRPLVIDPVLSFSTYLGGSGNDSGLGIAVDPTTGDILLTGSTGSTNFPTVNSLQSNFGGGISDAFVTRLSGDGSALVFSTYLGGSGADDGRGIAVDPNSGDVLITGTTSSTNFPTANPLQPNYGGGGYDVFVTRLSGDGSTLIFSTYLGGRSTDFGYGIVVDPTTGDVLITGDTQSTNFPTTHALQPNLRGNENAFVTRLSGDGSALVFSTYLGGSAFDGGTSIAVDPNSGDVLVIGDTRSTDFPTANPLQPNLRGNENVFVTRLSGDGSALVFSTYLGGSGFDFGNGIAVDPTSGDVLLTGDTSSTDFPTANPIQPNNEGQYDAFVTRIAF